MRPRLAPHVVVLMAAFASRLLGAPAAGEAPGPVLHRVVLRDGTALVSYGEFVRVGDRVVFSMPIGEPRGSRLQMVDLPAAAVDWETTASYAETVRAAQYAAARGEADYAALAGEVTATIREIALLHEPARRLEVAERLRRRLAGWPADHVGYRANDVRQMLSLLDEAIAEVRADAGVQTHEVSLVGTTVPSTVALLPDPSPAQTLEQMMTAARVADVPGDRVALLRALVAEVDRSRAHLPRAWARGLRDSAQTLLDVELRADRRYAALVRDALGRAESAVSAADVAGVERIMADVRARDVRMGRARRDVVLALLGALEERLDAARRLRQAREQARLRATALRAYRAGVAGAFDTLARWHGRLERIRARAERDPGRSLTWRAEGDRLLDQLRAVQPPDDLAAAHALLRSAVELAMAAFSAPARAPGAGDTAGLWDASAAAAGSLMLSDLARRAIADATTPRAPTGGAGLDR